MLQRLPLMLAALWWGSATAVGAWVVPMLFAHLGSPALAGAMAARLFTAQTWVALLCGLLMLWCWRRLASGRDSSGSVEAGCADSDPLERRPAVDRELADQAPQGLDIWILAGMLAAAVMEWGVSPRILARENLALWHSIGSALFAVQWLAAGVTLWRLGRVSPANVS
jgi:hypothetical protein